MKTIKSIIPYAEKLYISLSLIIIIFLAFQAYNPSKRLYSQCNNSKGTNANNVTNQINSAKLPEIDLPIKYFPEDTINWGSASPNKSTSDKMTWESAAVDIGSREVPTTNITLNKDDYSNKHEELPPLKTLDQIISENKEMIDIENYFYKNIIKKYGEFGIRFLPTFDPTIQEFDVDSDGEDEKIVYLCAIGGNHCPHRIIIVKDNKIVFSVSAGMTGLDLSPSGTGDGFYVKWVPIDRGWIYGLCCPPGYVNTRFVYKNNEFVPVYEQTHMYVQVNNTE